MTYILLAHSSIRCRFDLGRRVQVMYERNHTRCRYDVFSLQRNLFPSKIVHEIKTDVIRFTLIRPESAGATRKRIGECLIGEANLPLPHSPRSIGALIFTAHYGRRLRFR
jgi:hypothetical protein